jgi:hypothetical protein
LTTLKKTYRFAAVVTLLFLSSNILLPAGAAAVNLTCDMDEQVHNVRDCCESSETKHDNWSKDVDDCLSLSYCEQAVDGEQSDVPAILQHKITIAAVDLANRFDISLLDDEEPEIFEDQFVRQQHTLPLFLLNSVFLN